MDTLRLEPMEHRGQQCVAIVGQLHSAAYNSVRSFPGRLYSKTHGCWYIIYDPDCLARLAVELRRYQPVDVSERFALKETPGKANTMTALPEGYHEHLVRVRYSEATIKTYEAQLKQFISWLHPVKLEDLTEEFINRYMLHLANQKRVSISTQNTAINAIKFYLEKVHRGERKVYYVDRPMKETKLPHVLTQEEVKALISATRNVKHRCMILVLYSTGVRISELLNLRWSDFDVQKRQVFIHGGKGRKDRLTITSKKAIDYIRYYLDQHKPKEFLFEGVKGGRYSSRSVNQIIHRSAQEAGLTKRVSAHTLRHSFATHLLELREDIRYIQLLMGHDSSKTTERYTHMTTRGFKDIKSPLDSLGLDFDVPSTEDQ